MTLIIPGTTSSLEVEYPETSKMALETYIYKLKYLWQQCQEVLLFLYCFALIFLQWSCQKSLQQNTVNLKLANDWLFKQYHSTSRNYISLNNPGQFSQSLNDHLVPGTMEGKVQVNVVRCCILSNLSSKHINCFANPLCFRVLIYFREVGTDLLHQQ